MASHIPRANARGSEARLSNLSPAGSRGPEGSGESPPGAEDYLPVERPEGFRHQANKAAAAHPASTGRNGTPLETNRYEAKKTAARK